MGLLRIITVGSFPSEDRTFRAQTRGHAVAVDDAIKWLQQLLVTARIQDNNLRKGGKAPDDSFKEADLRGLLKEDE